MIFSHVNGIERHKSFEHFRAKYIELCWLTELARSRNFFKQINLSSLSDLPHKLHLPKHKNHPKLRPLPPRWSVNFSFPSTLDRNRLCVCTKRRCVGAGGAGEQRRTTTSVRGTCRNRLKRRWCSPSVECIVCIGYTSALYVPTKSRPLRVSAYFMLYTQVTGTYVYMYIIYIYMYTTVLCIYCRSTKRGSLLLPERKK